MADEPEVTETTETAPETTPEAIETAPEVTEEAPVNWRETISDPDLRKVAERFNSPTDAVKSIVDLRKRESTPRLPGKDATDEDKAAFRKAWGVPESAEGYKFEMPEGVESNDADKAFQEVMGQTFHDADISTTQAEKLSKTYNEIVTKVKAEIIKADEDFVKETEAALKHEWGDDYDRNKTLANRAAAEILGSDLEVASHLELKGDRFLLDHPIMVKAFAEVGKEMSEGRIGPRINETERTSLTQQADDLQQKKMAALDKGDSDQAAKYDREQAAIYDRLHGSEPIVGSEMRSL